MAITQEKYEELLAKTTGKAPPSATEKKPHKYQSKPTIVDGIRFPSLLEARCYIMLNLQWRAGAITEPLRQVRFSLGPHYGKERFYVADFVFIEQEMLIVADAKGAQTEEYLQKKAMMCALYGIRVREYRAGRGKSQQLIVV